MVLRIGKNLFRCFRSSLHVCKFCVKELDLLMSCDGAGSRLAGHALQVPLVQVAHSQLLAAFAGYACISVVLR